MVNFIVGFVWGVLVAIIICYFIPRQQVKSINRQQETEYKETLKSLSSQITNLSYEKDSLLKEKELIKGSVTELKEQVLASVEDFKESQFQMAETALDSALDQKAKEFQQAEDDYKKDYLNVLQDCVKELNETVNAKHDEIADLTEELDNLKSKVSSAIDAAKREQAEADEVNFYKLILSQEDLDEIEKLRSIEKYLRNTEPLNKVIWKVYYERPFNDLVGRLLSTDPASGIYKITDLSNKKAYIGQSVNLKERLRLHIKRGMGAEPPTNSILYPEMLKKGVENFTFEILEICPKAKLNDEERYWISYYETYDYGYNQTRGGS